MKPKELIEYYGKQQAAAKALGVTQQAVARWCSSGEIPLLRQYHVERVTSGKLKASVQ